MELIDGRIIAKQIKDEISKEVAELLDSGKRSPHLAAVIVGEDGASLSYVASKEKQSKEVGFWSSVYRFPENATEKELLQTVDFLNNDSETDGYIVQLPLPKHINEQRILNAIKPEKDIDGFHPINVGRMTLGLPSYVPATPLGIQTLLQRSGVETCGKHCVVLGRSNIVGTPVSILLSRNNASANCTVTLCHSRTENIKEICRQADILIVAIGKPKFVTEDMVKEGAVIIDVGIHRIKDSSEKGYKLVGDVDFENVKNKCSKITPVPGGVGPMTIASLLMNTLQAYKKEIYK
ncbi:MAG: bifunctional 5,10-methylene-tetrahydrofolate dehydrogenase/5,10-methylene-tetrahydrofolate cyclohydrolase [Bacteroidales bacterium]|jgi:methylenetetrahydrofolate dehydrogenase (NADP+)/methenyltetrahydrofolate cyclohydrolase|nr:bifunctional 5,10-methylene-tetrahydrofolate dehydrogenase/5,10-methylene-tetrahydrofolate cyclohydrolase [Bacteroidales bacterium]